MARGLLIVALALTILECVLLSAPHYILVRSQTHHVFTDHDLMYEVPDEVSWAQAGRRVRQERICSYFGGGRHLVYIPREVDDRCSLFREKPASYRLF